MAEETDYEQERLRNIRENEKLMRELGVMGGSSAIGGPPRPKKAAATTRRAKPATPKKDLTPKRIMPTRSSARLAGHEADSEVLKRKYEVSRAGFSIALLCSVGLKLTVSVSVSRRKRKRLEKWPRRRSEPATASLICPV